MSDAGIGLTKVVACDIFPCGGRFWPEISWETIDSRWWPMAVRRE